jgi:hypothetical protein
MALCALLVVVACSDEEGAGPATTLAGSPTALGGGGAGGSPGGGGGGSTSDEICDNQTDDDGDGLADCDDRDCALADHCPPWCEAAEGARCYYVDAEDGDDAADGSFEHPFRTYLNLVTYYGTPGELGSTAPPATAVDLQPGDAVYFMDGTYPETFNYHGDTEGFFARGKDGDADHWFRLEAYPGQQPVFRPGAPSGAIDLLQSSYWIVRGIEIDGATQFGIWVVETDQVELREVHIHDTDGVDNGNIAGLRMTSATNVLVTGCTLNDNYDRTAEDTGGQATENSSNMVAFGGGNIEISDCHVFNTLGIADDKLGGCLKYKHMRTLDGGTFVVRGNRLENCRFFSVGTGSPDSTIEGNLIQDSAPISLRDFGGPTALQNIRIRHNTMVNSPALSVNPDDGGDWVPLADLEFSGNVTVDDEASYDTDRAMVRIGSYDSNEQHAIATAAGVMTFEQNCYHNPNTALVFDLFGADNFGDQGDLYDFAGWQGQGYDQSSFDEDPAFDGDLRATSANCAGLGYSNGPRAAAER